jgi:hypothetical protein
MVISPRCNLSAHRHTHTQLLTMPDLNTPKVPTSIQLKHPHPVVNTQVTRLHPARSTSSNNHHQSRPRPTFRASLWNSLATTTTHNSPPVFSQVPDTHPITSATQQGPTIQDGHSPPPNLTATARTRNLRVAINRLRQDIRVSQQNCLPITRRRRSIDINSDGRYLINRDEVFPWIKSDSGPLILCNDSFVRSAAVLGWKWYTEQAFVGMDGYIYLLLKCHAHVKEFRWFTWGYASGQCS